MWKKSAIRRHAKRRPISSELFDTIARDDEATEFEAQRAEAENRMLAAARNQFGGGNLIEAETAQEQHEETPLQRGLRLLAITEPGDVDDLRFSIMEEIERDDDRARWDAACDARAAE